MTQKRPSIFNVSHDQTSETKNTNLLPLVTVDEAIQCLSQDVKPLIYKLVEATKGSKKIILSSFLSGICTVTQGRGSIKSPVGETSLSVYFLTIAESGHAKTFLSSFAYRPLFEYEKKQLIIFKLEKEEYEKQLKKFIARQKRNKTDDNDEEPEAPPSPKFLFDDITIDKLAEIISAIEPCVGLIEDEGGSFIGGYSMSVDNKIRTISILNKIWSNRSFSVERLQRSLYLYDCRLMISLFLQPESAKKMIIDDRYANDAGFVARLLVVLGNDRETDPKCMTEWVDRSQEYILYSNKMKAYASVRYASTDEGVSFDIITLSPDAYRIFADFFELTNSSIVQFEYSLIGSFLSKASEHALKIAGNLFLWEQDTHRVDHESVESDVHCVISKELMERAVKIVLFFAHELYNIKAIGTIEIQEQEQLLELCCSSIKKSMQDDAKDYVTFARWHQRYSPYKIRKNSKICLDVIDLLERLGRIIVIRGNNRVIKQIRLPIQK